MSITTKDIKRKIMLKRAEDKEIFDLINNTGVSYDCYDDLIYRNIFPFLKVDFTETQAGNYIGVGIDYPVVRARETFKRSRITFLIICNTATLRIGNSSYTRTDSVAERIIELFQNSNELGYDMELYSDIEDIHSSKFYYRELVFQSKSNNIPGECE